MFTEELDVDPLLNGTYENWAKRFEVLSQFAAQFSTVEKVRELMNSVLSNDPMAFPDLVSNFDFPVFNKTVWVRDVVTTVTSESGGLVMECWLRDDMTPNQKQTYLSILAQFGYLPSGPDDRVSLEKAVSLPITEHNNHLVVAPGPLLEALKAADLINRCDNAVPAESVVSEKLAYTPLRPVTL